MLRSIPTEPIEAALKTLRDFNKLDLSKVQLTKNDRNIKMNNLEEFRYTGLSNKDYIRLRFWKSPSKRSAKISILRFTKI